MNRRKVCVLYSIVSLALFIVMYLKFIKSDTYNCIRVNKPILLLPVELDFVLHIVSYILLARRVYLASMLVPNILFDYFTLGYVVQVTLSLLWCLVFYVLDLYILGTIIGNFNCLLSLYFICIWIHTNAIYLIDYLPYFTITMLDSWLSYRIMLISSSGKFLYTDIY